jgi:predicted nucleic acid-binding protein
VIAPIVVVDASVVLAWLQAKRAPAWVERLWSELRGGSVRISVPSILWLEVGNALARRGDLSDEQALEGLLRVEALGFMDVALDAPLRLRALALARSHHLTTYDSVYLALADSLGARLATLDGRLGVAAAELGLLHAPLPTRRLAEPRALYGARPPDPISLAALGARLAELRLEREAAPDRPRDAV